MPYLAPQIFFALFGASELGLAIFKRSGGSAQKSDAGSLRMLWVTIGVAMAASVLVSVRVPAASFRFSPGTYVAAVCIFLFGSFLRWWSIIYLGKFFTADVAIASDHRVIDSGPYRHIRHPSYTGILLQFTALSLMLFNGASIAVMLIPVVWAFSRRIRVEEAALQSALGDDYRQYQTRTSRLIPMIY